MPKGVFLRGEQFYFRRTIPTDAQALLKRLEIWKSLRTVSGHRVRVLHDAINKLAFADIDMMHLISATGSATGSAI